MLLLPLSQSSKLDDRALLRLCGSSSLQQLHLHQVHPWIMTTDFLQQQLAPELPDIQLIMMEGMAVYDSSSASRSGLNQGSTGSGKQQQRSVSGKSSKSPLSAAAAAGGGNRGAGGRAAGAAAAAGGGGSSAVGVDGRSDVASWKAVRRSSEGGDDSRNDSAGQGKLRVGSCPTAVAWERPLKLQDKELELRSRERSMGSFAAERKAAPLAAYDERFKYSMSDVMALRDSPLAKDKVVLDPAFQL